MIKRLLLAGVIAAFGAAPALAQVTAITNARIISLGPAGDVIGGTVLVRDGKIAAVGKSVQIPSGAHVIDAKGQFLTPGLMMAPTPLALKDIIGNSGGRGSTLENLSAAYEVADDFNPAPSAHRRSPHRGRDPRSAHRRRPTHRQAVRRPGRAGPTGRTGRRARHGDQPPRGSLHERHGGWFGGRRRRFGRPARAPEAGAGRRPRIPEESQGLRRFQARRREDVARRHGGAGPRGRGPRTAADRGQPRPGNPQRPEDRPRGEHQGRAVGGHRGLAGGQGNRRRQGSR
jgi:hypothetical protein